MELVFFRAQNIYTRFYGYDEAMMHRKNASVADTYINDASLNLPGN